jgi:hypothetical protein
MVFQPDCDTQHAFQRIIRTARTPQSMHCTLGVAHAPKRVNGIATPKRRGSHVRPGHEPCTFGVARAAEPVDGIAHTERTW